MGAGVIFPQWREMQIAAIQTHRQRRASEAPVHRLEIQADAHHQSGFVNI